MRRNEKKDGSFDRSSGAAIYANENLFRCITVISRIERSVQECILFYFIYCLREIIGYDVNIHARVVRFDLLTVDC